MVRSESGTCFVAGNFPRIRGDGPDAKRVQDLIDEFSPYSRGWSQREGRILRQGNIFPVFAGMVRVSSAPPPTGSNFPRIRGDGPKMWVPAMRHFIFSPYSRGWSGYIYPQHRKRRIFPVFAGMVPHHGCLARRTCYFPRIRGDGPRPQPSIEPS